MYIILLLIMLYGGIDRINENNYADLTLVAEDL